MENIEPIIPSSQDKWLKLIDILQNDLNLDVYPGGYSAITGWYHRHDFIFHPIIEKLYGLDIDKIPTIILEGDWQREFYLYKSDWFPKDLGIDKVKTRDYKLKIPSLERALLEMVYDVDIRTSFDTIYDYFGDLHSINPKMFQTLLEHCTSQKIKRLGLFLAEEFCWGYYDKINLTNIKLDLTENMDLADNQIFPSHIPKYNLEVPGHLEWEVCKNEPYYRGNQLSARAV